VQGKETNTMPTTPNRPSPDPRSTDERKTPTAGSPSRSASGRSAVPPSEVYGGHEAPTPHAPHGPRVPGTGRRETLAPDTRPGLLPPTKPRLDEEGEEAESDEEE
jgi:hypothetical protein